jgi:transcriptional antiterminator RfaH
VPYWCCAQLVPNRTALALHCLQQVAGYEVYCPRIVPPRTGKKTARSVVPRLLFPGYAFLLVVGGWWSARWSAGVVRLVMDGAQPARVPDAVIEDIRSREVCGLVELPKRDVFKAGDQVRIVAGAFAGHLGLYAGMRSHERVLVLLALLGGQQRVELAQDAVEVVQP